MLKLLAAASLFYAVVEVLALLGSLVHLTISRPIALFIIVLAVLFAVIYWRRLRERPPSAPLAPPGPTALGFLCLTLALYLVLWLLSYALPDFSYDGNYYHAPAIHFWARKGYIHWISPGPSPHWGPIGTFAWNGYPKAVEVIGYIFLQAGGCSRLLNSVNLLFLPLGGLAITSLALTLGAFAGFALAAGCLFIYLPINLSQSLTAMVDTGSAACYLAFFALLLGTVKRITAGEMPWHLLAGLSSALGLAVGSKGTGLALIPAGTLVLLVRVILARREGRGEVRPDTKSRPPVIRSISFIAVTIIISLGIGGFWAVRNWVRTGNPFAPAEITVAGYELFPGVDISTQFRPPYREGTKEWSQPARVAANWTSCLRLGELRNYVYDSRWGGLGFVWLGSIPAVILLLLIRWRRRRDTPSSGTAYLPDLVFVCLVMFIAMPRHHNHMARYTIWLAGLGLPCLAVVAGTPAVSATAGRWRRYSGYAWFGAICLLAVGEAVTSLRLHASFLDDFRGSEATTPVLNRVLRAARSPYPAAYRWADFKGSIFEMIMAGDDPVAVAIKEKNQRHLIFGHLVQGPALGNREIVFIDHDRAERDPDYLTRLFRENVICYVIWDSTLPLYRDLVNGSVRQDYGLGEGLWHVFTFAPPEAVNP